MAVGNESANTHTRMTVIPLIVPSLSQQCVIKPCFEAVTNAKPGWPCQDARQLPPSRLAAWRFSRRSLGFSPAPAQQSSSCLGRRLSRPRETAENSKCPTPPPMLSWRQDFVLTSISALFLSFVSVDLRPLRRPASWRVIMPVPCHCLASFDEYN